MSAGWVACSVRARAMTSRRLGKGAVRQLATSPSLEAALAVLGRGPYGRDVRPHAGLADAQRAVVATLVWNARVLAGWAPRGGAAALRVLVGPVEIAAVEDHLRRMAGEDPPAPHRLGGLATAWPRLARTTSPQELQRALTRSAWGDPGGTTPREVGLAMRTALADRALAVVPTAGAWAAGATALLLAREVAGGGRDLPPAAQRSASRVVGAAAVSARTLPGLAASLPRTAQWALEGVASPTDLWRAEARWWTRVESDGLGLARRAAAGPEVVVGAVAVLGADAWRVRAALEVAARGGGPLEDVDAVA